MIPAQNAKTVLMVPVANAAGVTNEMSFDRTGYDYCSIDILDAVTSTQTSAIATIVVSESDTLTTAAAMTAIPALSGSTATSTTYGFALPAAAATADGRVTTLNFDLKPRKKYIGLIITATAAAGATSIIAAVAHLTRGEETPITVADRDGINLYDTNIAGCVQVVNG